MDPLARLEGREWSMWLPFSFVTTLLGPAFQGGLRLQMVSLELGVVSIERILGAVWALSQKGPWQQPRLGRVVAEVLDVTRVF